LTKEGYTLTTPELTHVDTYTSLTYSYTIVLRIHFFFVFEEIVLRIHICS